MYKHNIAHDLLKILKRKNETEIYYVIGSMANGTYNYEIEYLKKVPYQVLMAYLEKILVVVSGYRLPENLEDALVVLDKFASNLDDITFRDLNANKFLNVKYYLKAKNAQVAKELIKRTSVVRLSSIFLTCFIFLNLYNNELQLGTAHSEEDNSLETSLEIIDDTKAIDNTITFSQPTEDFQESLAYDYETNTATIPNAEETISNAVIENPVEVEETTVPKELTNEEKLQCILEEYNLTPEEFNVVCAVALREAKQGSYVDTYASINTIYNRTISKTWINYISGLLGTDKGYSLYYQAICDGQFEVYATGFYKDCLDIREGEAYQAIIDFLYTKEVMHDFLSFKSAGTELNEYVQFVDGGNKYHNEMKLEDRIDSELSR